MRGPIASGWNSRALAACSAVGHAAAGSSCLIRSGGCHIARNSYHTVGLLCCARMVNVGDAMPDSTLASDAGPVKLRDTIGKPLVVYFYPKDETHGCTKEACSFRDSYEDFIAAGAEVIGISRDDATLARGFKATPQAAVHAAQRSRRQRRDAWGVKKTFGLIPGRVTFVFDKAGVCKSRFESQIRVGKHVDEALALVKKLAA